VKNKKGKGRPAKKTSHPVARSRGNQLPRKLRQKEIPEQRSGGRQKNRGPGEKKDGGKRGSLDKKKTTDPSGKGTRSSRKKNPERDSRKPRTTRKEADATTNPRRNKKNPLKKKTTLLVKRAEAQTPNRWEERIPLYQSKKRTTPMQKKAVTRIKLSGQKKNQHRKLKDCDKRG